jgi:aryl-alcohol dehydrogenase-like predicted oxidoreductase
VHYRLLGRSGVRVSSLCLGTVFFGTHVAEPDVTAIVHAALDAGINFVDTAETYPRPHYGVAESVVGRALRGRRHEVVLATKKRYDPASFRSGTPADRGLSRHQIVDAVEASLRRLQTDYLDLYYPHQVDPETDLEITLRAFDDLLAAGKVRAVGLPNYPAWLTVEALWIADRRNFASPVCVQSLYNLLARDVERELVPACARHGLSLVTYSPLAGGVLTGKYGAGEAPPDSRAAHVGHTSDGRPSHIPLLTPASLAAASRLSTVAGELGLSAAQAALAWTLHRPHVASVIFGASSVAQLEHALTADEIALDERAQGRLSEAVSSTRVGPA